MTCSILLGTEGFNGIAFTASELGRSEANATLLSEAEALAVQIVRVQADRAEAISAAREPFDVALQELSHRRLQLIEGANAIAFDVLDSVRQRDPSLQRSVRRLTRRKASA